MEVRSILERITRRIVIGLIAFAFSIPTDSHPKSWQHIAEMYSVLPFATDRDGNVVPENFPIRIWLETITKDLIDEYNRVGIKEYGGRTFYEYLKDEFDFGLSSGNHRVLFHWGYNSKPWNKELDRYVIYKDWDIDKINRFKEALIAEQRRRNSIANKETEKVFGFASGGEEARWANGLLAIVYDVHLLGDYTSADNKNFRGVTEPSKVAGDIINSVRRIDGSIKSQRIVDSIRKKTSLYSDQHILASELILTLQEELPKFLMSAKGGELKRRFKNRGFKLK